MHDGMKQRSDDTCMPLVHPIPRISFDVGLVFSFYVLHRIKILEMSTRPVRNRPYSNR